MKIVIGLFYAKDAFAAARHLDADGFRFEDFSIISSGAEIPYEIEGELAGEPEVAAAGGATVGAVAGSSIGALGALVASTIPGLEAMFVSGLISTAAGGVIGGYLGSLYNVRAESQTEIDIDEALSEGQLLLVVKTSEAMAGTAAALMEENGGQHVEIHAVPNEQDNQEM